MKRYTLITLLMAIGVCPIAAQNIIVTSAEGQNVENFVRSNFLGGGVHVFNVKFNNTPRQHCQTADRHFPKQRFYRRTDE